MVDIQKPEDITLISEPVQEMLDTTQRLRYKQFRKRFRDWLYSIGKDPVWLDST